MLLSILLAGAAMQPAGVLREGDTVFLRADIDAASSRALIAHLQKGANRIVVERAGGSDQKAALALAQAVRSAKAQVHVSGICSDTCATYLFLPAPSKTLWTDAVLGLRDLTLDRDYQDALTQLGKADAVSTRAKENVLLAEAGISPNLLKAAHEAANPQAHRSSLRYKDASGREVKYENIGIEAFRHVIGTLGQQQPKALQTLRVQTRWEQPRLWFPPRAVLERYGVSGIQGYAYPLNADAAKALAQRYGVSLSSSWDQASAH